MHKIMPLSQIVTRKPEKSVTYSYLYDFNDFFVLPLFLAKRFEPTYFKGLSHFPGDDPQTYPQKMCITAILRKTGGRRAARGRRGRRPEASLPGS
jgi:hypothetical protein